MVRAWKIILPKTTPHTHSSSKSRQIDRWIEWKMENILLCYLWYWKIVNFNNFDPSIVVGGERARDFLIRFFIAPPCHCLSPRSYHDDKLNNCKTSIKNLLIVEIFCSFHYTKILLLLCYWKGENCMDFYKCIEYLLMYMNVQILSFFIFPCRSNNLSSLCGSDIVIIICSFVIQTIFVPLIRKSAAMLY